MGLIETVSLIREVYRRRNQADRTFTKTSMSGGHALIDSYDEWTEYRRNLNCVALTSILAGHFCSIENQAFDGRRRLISFYAAAAARVADDIQDNSRGKQNAYLLMGPLEDDRSPEARLFNFFNSSLEGLVAAYRFKSRFSHIIDDYNIAQESAAQLARPITQSQVIQIKNGTGGYPFLLLHSLMNTNQEDPSRLIENCYQPDTFVLPINKHQAIFNLGALVSRVDDLYDQRIDRKLGLKSLATEGLISMDSLTVEIRYVEEGLKKFYQAAKVDFMMQPFRDLQLLKKIVYVRDVIGSITELMREP